MSVFVDVWVFSLNVNPAFPGSTVFPNLPFFEFPMYVDPYGAMNAIDPPWLLGLPNPHQ